MNSRRASLRMPIVTLLDAWSVTLAAAPAATNADHTSPERSLLHERVAHVPAGLV